MEQKSKKDNSIVDKLVDMISKQFDVSFEDIRKINHFEDKRVPGQYAIRLFIRSDYLDYAVRHAVVGQPFKASKDIIETSFLNWPPPSMEFNEMFRYADEKGK